MLSVESSRGTASKAELSGASISSTSLAMATASILGLDWEDMRILF